MLLRKKTLSALSTFKKLKNRPSTFGQLSQLQHSQTRLCPQCKKKFKPFKRGRHGVFNKKAYTVCYDCWEKNKKRNCAAFEETDSDDNEMPTEKALEVHSFILSHHARIVSSHPRIDITVTHMATNRSVPVNCIVDLGAQSNL